MSETRESNESTVSSLQTKLLLNDGISENNKKNVILLNQIVPFILNTSHYMTDLMYVLYYLAQKQEDEVLNDSGTFISHKKRTPCTKE